MQHVYKLNLPELNTILDNSFILPTIVNIKNNYKILKPLDGIVRKEYLNIQNYAFNYALVFLKCNGESGKIHKDGNDNAMTTWGINFISGGLSKMEYWDDSQIIQSDVIVDEAYSQTTRIIVNTPATYTYMMPPGAYLINTHVAHRATGYDSRIAFSLRSADAQDKKWDSVVTSFEPLIDQTYTGI